MVKGDCCCCVQVWGSVTSSHTTIIYLLGARETDRWAPGGASRRRLWIYNSWPTDLGNVCLFLFVCLCRLFRRGVLLSAHKMKYCSYWDGGWWGWWWTLTPVCVKCPSTTTTTLLVLPLLLHTRQNDPAGWKTENVSIAYLIIQIQTKKT